MGGGLPSGEGGLDPFRFAFCYIFISLYFASFFGGLKTICCCRCCQLQGRGNRGTLSQHPPFLCAPLFLAGTYLHCLAIFKQFQHDLGGTFSPISLAARLEMLHPV